MSFSWDSAYLGTPPWDIGRPQSVVVRTAEAGDFTGDVLDAGCGTGENALYLAAQGLHVTGVDWSARAIELARSKAAERANPAEFIRADALHLDTLGRTFQSVLDCGLFHTFDDTARATYVRSLAGIVPPGGRLHLLCFSDREPWGSGPRRVHQAEIREAFADGWRVERIEPDRFDTRMPASGGAQAWHAVIERR